MNRAFAASYKRLQDRHWWFHGRSRVLRALLARLDWPADPTVLEVGVGPGHGLGEIYPAAVRLIGLEADADLCREARAVSGVPVYHGTLDAVPQEVRSAPINVTAMFDVLEHIEDDRGALGRIRALLPLGGLLLLTVPAYQWMWGRQDVVNHHYRRYRLHRLEGMLAACGFEVVRGTYFNTLLFAPIALFRLIASASKGECAPGKNEQPGRSDFDVTLGPFDEVLARVFGLEAVIVPRLRLPFGVSIFVAARKV
jgi:hypothetical protein